MPLLDVGDVILDPFLCSSFSILRTIQYVNQDGVAYTTSSVIAAYGTVTNGAPEKFVRSTGYEVNKDTLYVVTPVTLYTVENIAGTQYQPDLIIINNIRYSVMKVKNYSIFGGGFTEAICEIFDTQGSPENA